MGIENSEKVEDKEKLDESLFHCTLCDDIFVEPCRLHCCGHTFCRICLAQHLIAQPECPQCTRKIVGPTCMAYTRDIGMHLLTLESFPEACAKAYHKALKRVETKKNTIKHGEMHMAVQSLVQWMDHVLGPNDDYIRVKIRMDDKQLKVGDKEELVQIEGTLTTLRCPFQMPAQLLKELIQKKYIQHSGIVANLYTRDCVSIEDDLPLYRVLLNAGRSEDHCLYIYVDADLEPMNDVIEDMPVLEKECYSIQDLHREAPTLTRMLEEPCATSLPSHPPSTSEPKKSLPNMTSSLVQQLHIKSEVSHNLSSTTISSSALQNPILAARLQQPPLKQLKRPSETVNPSSIPAKIPSMMDNSQPNSTASPRMPDVASFFQHVIAQNMVAQQNMTQNVTASHNIPQNMTQPNFSPTKLTSPANSSFSLNPMLLNMSKISSNNMLGLSSLQHFPNMTGIFPVMNNMTSSMFTTNSQPHMTLKPGVAVSPMRREDLDQLNQRPTQMVSPFGGTENEKLWRVILNNHNDELKKVMNQSVAVSLNNSQL